MGQWKDWDAYHNDAAYHAAQYLRLARHYERRGDLLSLVPVNGCEEWVTIKGSDHAKIMMANAEKFLAKLTPEEAQKVRATATIKPAVESVALYTRKPGQVERPGEPVQTIGEKIEQLKKELAK